MFTCITRHGLTAAPRYYVPHGLTAAPAYTSATRALAHHAHASTRTTYTRTMFTRTHSSSGTFIHTRTRAHVLTRTHSSFTIILRSYYYRYTKDPLDDNRRRQRHDHISFDNEPIRLDKIKTYNGSLLNITSTSDRYCHSIFARSLD